MFFFIGGITPKIKRLNETPGLCPGCGSSFLYRVRIEHYLNIFFIPLFPVKKGNPFYLCTRCGLELPEERRPGFGWEARKFKTGENCPACHRKVEPDFRFCPFCGQPLI